MKPVAAPGELEAKLIAVIGKTHEEVRKELNSQVKDLDERLLRVTWRLYDNLGDQAAKSNQWSSGVTWHLHALPSEH
jgi:hypothetical protein